ncbi:MAG: hypothetical protein EP329_18360 [Deltaproteobacteria bacterium]|nr:MAG: hypothetical protein EP329_18360 [Deltaproteobacteria bacterium]
MDPLTRPLKRIGTLVRRVRWRLRGQLALRRLLVLGGVGLLVFGVLVLLVKARALPTSWTYVGGGVAIGLAALGVLSGLLRRLDDVRLAALLDEAGGLHSRLGTALAFAREPNPTAFQRAAIEDAVSVVERASPKAASPWQWAAFAVGAGVAAVALAVSVPSVFVVRFPVGRVAAVGVAPLGAVPEVFTRGKLGLDRVELAQLEVLDEAVANHRATAADPEVKGFLDALDELVKALKEGKIGADEAFAKLAALEKAEEAWSETHAEDLDEVRQALKEAAEKQRRGAHEDAEALLEALRKQALEEAAKTLESAADKVDKGMSERERQQLSRDLQKLAKSLESDRQEREREARRDRDRLKKKEERDKDRFSKRDRDRLKKRERELEQLRREQEQLSEARRQLERLQRDLDQAAADLLRRLMENAESMSSEELRRAAEMLRRMQEQAQGRQQMRTAKSRMGDLRELLRRAGERQRGGSKKGGAGGESEMERFYARAGGQPQGAGKDGDPKGGAEGKEGAGGKGGKEALMLGDGKGGGQDKLTLVGLGQGPGNGQGGTMPMPGRGGDAGSPQEGEGIGEGHDSRLLGERTKMAVKTQEDFVAGQQGAGESASRVVYAAASKGFASTAYRDVHQDYSEVVEDDLDRQKIPPGQRTYVRRYFDLIRPR